MKFSLKTLLRKFNGFEPQKGKIYFLFIKGKKFKEKFLKKTMKKILLILMLIILILSLSKVPAIKLKNYSYTKAFCNETNYCQDYEIKCSGEKLIKLIPITGASIQFSENWKDTREKKDSLCDKLP